MHRSTARVVGMACIALGVLQIGQGIGRLFALLPLDATPDQIHAPVNGTPNLDDVYYSVGTNPWYHVVMMPAAMLLVAGGTMLVRGRDKGRYPALAYAVLTLGVLVVSRIFVFIRLAGALPSINALVALDLAAGLMDAALSWMPSLLLLVFLVRPIQEPADSDGDTSTVDPVEDEIARAEIVRLGWFSTGTAVLGLACWVASTVFMLLAVVPSDTTIVPPWTYVSIALRMLASMLLLFAGINLLRFRRRAIRFAILQAALAPLITLFTQAAIAYDFYNRTQLIRHIPISQWMGHAEAWVPWLLIGVLACLPHVRRRLTPADQAVDAQPSLDESEMPPA